MKDKKVNVSEFFEDVIKEFNKLETVSIGMHKNSAYIKAIRKCKQILCDEYNNAMGAQV